MHTRDLQKKKKKKKTIIKKYICMTSYQFNKMMEEIEASRQYSVISYDENKRMKEYFICMEDKFKLVNSNIIGIGKIVKDALQKEIVE